MNRDQTYLNHILDAIARIDEYTSVGYDKLNINRRSHSSCKTDPTFLGKEKRNRGIVRLETGLKVRDDQRQATPRRE
jgi:hypothetical protein